MQFYWGDKDEPFQSDFSSVEVATVRSQRDMEVSIVMGATPKMDGLVKFVRENPIRMDGLGVPPF